MTGNERATGKDTRGGIETTAGRTRIGTILACQPTRLTALQYATNHIRARWEIMLEDRLPSTLHIYKNSLPEMPTQKLIYWYLRFIEKSAVKMFTSDTLPIECKAHNLVMVLK
jgi:hypothetical protein